MSETNLLLILDFLRDMQGLFGIIVGSGATYLAGASSRRADKDKQIRELGVSLGRDKLTIAERIARTQFNTAGVPCYVPSLNVCVMNGVRAAKILLDTSLTAEKSRAMLAELDTFTDGVIREEKQHCHANIND